MTKLFYVRTKLRAMIQAVKQAGSKTRTSYKKLDFRLRDLPDYLPLKSKKISKEWRRM